MIRTYTYKLYRNPKIEKRFSSYVGACRFVYNAAKETKETAWKAGVSLSKYDLIRQLTDAKKAVPFLNEVNAQSLQGAVEQLDLAYKHYFRKLQSGEVAKAKAAYLRNKENADGKINYRRVAEMCRPNWARKGDFNSVVFKQGTKQTKEGFTLSKFGSFRVHNNRPIPGKIKTARIVKRADGLYLSVVAEVPDRINTISENQAVGIDMGIAYFAVTSEGEHIQNPRFLEKQLPALRRAQRSLSRKTKGSIRWKRQRQVVARLYKRISDARRDFLHKQSTALCQRYETIVRGDLNVSGMVRGKLSRHIADVSWASFFQMLDFKAARVVKVNPAYTSQGCNKCGAVDAKSRISQSAFCCTSCGHTTNADLNAAQNILGRAFPDTREARPLGQGLGVKSQKL